MPAIVKLPDPTDRHVGARIRMRRLMLDMSQERLGEELGITFQQVQKYEKGSNRVSASRIQRIAAVLQVPVSFFFEGGPNELQGAGGKTMPHNYVADFLATSDGLALVKAFMDVADPKLRRRIVELVEQVQISQRP
jgi:transcriptional regulator with XRE-family HTH domain